MTASALPKLEALKPSSQDAILMPVLMELPLGNIYCYSFDDFEAIMRIDRWSGGFPRCSGWAPEGRWISSEEARAGEFRYPKLPAMVFRETDGAKTVTRRSKLPKWCKPGALFHGWDRSFRVGRGKARGLGVFEIVSVVNRTRYQCPSCHGPLFEHGPGYACPKYPSELVDFMVDTLTPDELAREGFPDMTADDFWAMLAKLGGVDESGRTFRIEFRRL